MSMTKEGAVREYQCSGCRCGMDQSCGSFVGSYDGCRGHHPGIYMTGFTLALGLPKGFNRVGMMDQETTVPVRIFETFDAAVDKGEYNKYNVPVWAHVNEHGHTIVRMFQPRLSRSEVHVIMEDCLDRVKPVYVFTAEELQKMD